MRTFYPYIQGLLDGLSLLEDLVLLGHDVVEAGHERLHVDGGAGHVAGADHGAVAVAGPAEKIMLIRFGELFIDDMECIF